MKCKIQTVLGLHVCVSFTFSAPENPLGGWGGAPHSVHSTSLDLGVDRKWRADVSAATVLLDFCLSGLLWSPQHSALTQAPHFHLPFFFPPVLMLLPFLTSTSALSQDVSVI